MDGLSTVLKMEKFGRVRNQINEQLQQFVYFRNCQNFHDIVMRNEIISDEKFTIFLCQICKWLGLNFVDENKNHQIFLVDQKPNITFYPRLVFVVWK